MWKQLLTSLLKALGLAAVDAGTAIAKEKLAPTPKGAPRDTGRKRKS